MKTTMIRGKIKQLLQERPRSTTEILDHINATYRHGTTINALVNVLGRDKDIVKIGYVERAGSKYGPYQVCQWDLSSKYDGITPEVKEYVRPQKTKATQYLKMVSELSDRLEG